MATPALTLISLVAAELQDTAYVRWSQAVLLGYLNDAQAAIVLARPDANAVIGNATLIAGTKQSLPTGGLRLLDVYRNMGVGGATPGRRVRMSLRNPHEAVSPNWSTATSSLVIEEVFYDDRVPLTFWTNPPATVNATIQMGYSKAPTVLTVPGSDNIELPDVYRTPIEEWMFYRAYSQNVQAQGGRARANEHLKNFYVLLGLYAQAEKVDSPNAMEANG